MKTTLSAFILFFMMLTSCSGGKKQLREEPLVALNKDRVEVLYFHGKQRCVTCNAIERLTKEALDEHFSTELADGKIVFRVIDISEKENEALADKYEVSWASLFINQWHDSEEISENMTDFGFSYAKSSPDLFKQGIREKVTTLLK